jgi:hypothetical protein
MSFVALDAVWRRRHLTRIYPETPSQMLDSNAELMYDISVEHNDLARFIVRCDYLQCHRVHCTSAACLTQAHATQHALKERHLHKIYPVFSIFS